jgi:hypothetical protein
MFVLFLIIHLLDFISLSIHNSLLMLAVSDWSPVSGLTLFFLHFRSKKEAIATKPDSAAIVPTVDPIIFDFPSWVSLFEVCFVVFGVYVCLLVLPRINLTDSSH